MIVHSSPRVGLMVPSIFLSREFARDDVARFVQIAEAAGASSLMVGDHLNWYASTYECLTLASHVAAHATSARVGTNVVVLPLRQPFLVAKMATTIAALAPAGFALGVGVGGEHPVEFEALGVPREGRGLRTDEGLALIRQLLEGGTVDFEGTHVNSRGAHLDPLVPFPVLVGGRSDAALRRVARFSDGWSAAWVRPDSFHGLRARIEELAVSYGRDAGRFEWIAHTRVTLAPSPEEAWTEAEGYLATYYNADPAAFRAHTLLGPPEEVAPKIAAFFEAGAQEVLVTIAGYDILSQLEVFAERVMPLVMASR